MSVGRLKVPKSNPSGHGTDWKGLRRVSAAKIRAGIESDPDAHATNAAFWKDAKVVFLEDKGRRNFLDCAWRDQIAIR